MRRRPRITRLYVRARLILLILAAIGIVLFPYGMLQVFEGMEKGQGGLTIIPPPHTVPVMNVNVTALPTVSNALSDSSSTSSSTLLSTSQTSLPLRPDLPKRQLTSFVNPLIGTEGPGHGIVSLSPH